MKITKFGHCCLLIEIAGKRVLTDPGAFSVGYEHLSEVDIILITHEHADHCHTESILALVETNPGVTIISNSSVARLLKDSNFIDGVIVADATVGKTMTLRLNPENSNSRITEIKRLSKPGRRYYVNAKEIPVVMRGRGIVIVSTSRGLMTGKAAKSANIGGELICKIY